MTGFGAFLRAVFWLPCGILSDLGDTLLVLVRLKYRPATGRARWQSDRPRPDPRAGAWQHLNQGVQRDDEASREDA